MNRRAKRPLDTAAAAKADDDFYAVHPERVVGGKRQPIPMVADDPCSQRLADEWLDQYVARGGKTDPVALPPCKPGQVMITCSGSASPTLSQAQAKALFNELKANPNIPFDYPVDCCYSRAHSMCGMMKARGIECRKYWLYNKNFDNPKLSTSDLKPKKADGSRVTFPDPSGMGQPVKWVYHVAPLVKVKMADGSIEDRVMDPSIADGPVTKAQWRKIQGDPVGAYDHESDSDAYFTEPRSKYTEADADFSQACTMMKLHAAKRDASRDAEAARAKAAAPKKMP